MEPQLSACPLAALGRDFTSQRLDFFVCKTETILTDLLALIVVLLTVLSYLGFMSSLYETEHANHQSAQT